MAAINGIKIEGSCSEREAISPSNFLSLEREKNSLQQIALLKYLDKNAVVWEVQHRRGQRRRCGECSHTIQSRKIEKGVHGKINRN